VVDGTRSKGFEVTIQGNIKDLSIIAGYAYNDHLVTQDNSISKQGFRFLNAPRNIGNIWLNYQFCKTALRGIGIGIGGRYISDQVGNISTQKYLVPESTVLDASLSYSIKQFSFQTNVYNFTDQRYFNGGLSRIPYSSLGNPINVRLGIGYLIK
jgi:iron complex outermembrane receptor protein